MAINRYWKEPGFNQQQYLSQLQQNAAPQDQMAVMPDRVSIGGLSQMTPMQNQPMPVNSILQNMYKGVDFSSPSPMQQPRPMQMGPQRRSFQTSPRGGLTALFAPEQPFYDAVFQKGYFDQENFGPGGGFNFTSENFQFDPQQSPQRAAARPTGSVSMQLSPFERYEQYRKQGLIR